MLLIIVTVRFRWICFDGALGGMPESIRLTIVANSLGFMLISGLCTSSLLSGIDDMRKLMFVGRLHSGFLYRLWNADGDIHWHLWNDYGVELRMNRR